MSKGAAVLAHRRRPGAPDQGSAISLLRIQQKDLSRREGRNV